MSRFEQLGIQPLLVKQCAYMAFETPTEIQEFCIPAILKGKNVAGCAATGSGKTAAFVLPLLQILSENIFGVFALVLTPSRELAYQIADQFLAFGAPMRINIALVIGGVPPEKQLDALKARPSIVVATPGRLVYMFEKLAEVKQAFRHLRYLVLDEADRLTEGDIQHDVSRILEHLPPRPQRRALLFSATLGSSLMSPSAGLAPGEETSFLMKLGIQQEEELAVFRVSEPDPSGVDTALSLASAQQQKQPDALPVQLPAGLRNCYLFIPNLMKLPNLVCALRFQGKTQSTIVFTNSCRRCELVRLTLQLLGFPVCSLNSLLTQQHRIDNLALFKLGIARILVATDIVSRGLDIPRVDFVIHYDIPKQARTFVHRAGRVARAGRIGTSVAFITEFDVELVHTIEKKLRIKLKLWKNKELTEAEVIAVLDEVSEAKLQAQEQITEQFGRRVEVLKRQAAEKKEARRQTQQQSQRAVYSRPVSTVSSRSAPSLREANASVLENRTKKLQKKRQRE